MLFYENSEDGMASGRGVIHQGGRSGSVASSSFKELDHLLG
jgi:hypothetical protein